MYLQLTTRCNMTCAHCCFAATSKGEDMTIEIVRAALNIMDDCHITLGGGEPTLNPNFESILYMCLTKYNDWDESYVWLATNGSNEKITLDLAHLATKFKPEQFGVALSVDHYHDYDMVSDKVREEFSRLSKKYPNIERRNVTNSAGLINAGRAKKNKLGEKEGCTCCDLFIKPNGDIRMCGCADSITLGNVLTTFDYEMYSDLVDKYSECGHIVNKELKKKLRKVS